MDKTVFIVGGDFTIERMYRHRGFDIVNDIEDAHIIQFTGGEDVTPALYGALAHPRTRNNPARDEREKKVFNLVRGHDKLKVGICRGSQFLCAMSGGRLFQDVNNHAIDGTHPLVYNGGRPGVAAIVYVTSTHHQMQDPSQLGGNAQVWGYTVRSTFRDGEEQLRQKLTARNKPDTEIVYYKLTSSLGFQPHPEYGVQECEDLFFTCLERADEYRKFWKQEQERFEDIPIEEDLNDDDDVIEDQPD